MQQDIIILNVSTYLKQKLILKEIDKSRCRLKHPSVEIERFLRLQKRLVWNGPRVSGCTVNMTRIF